MKKILFFLLYWPIILHSQEIGYELLKEKVNQHNLSFETLAISYSYAHKFSSTFTAGVQVQTGLAARFMLNNPYYYYDCAQCSQPIRERFRKSNPVYYLDVVKLSLFYRKFIGNIFYIDTGPFVSVGIFNPESFAVSANFGMDISGFILIKKFNLGIRLQGAWHNIPSPEINNNYWGVFVIPLVIGYNF